MSDLFDSNCTTDLIYIPPCCTSLVQPVDVMFNKPCKSYIDQLATQHMQENLDDYVHSRINGSQRRVLFTKWVGKAWEKITSDNKDSVIRTFRKCGISVAIDGSEDDEIRIRGLDEYQVERDDVESETDDDPFASSSEDEESDGMHEMEINN